MAPAYNSLARTVHGEWQGAQVAQVNCDLSPEIGNRYQITGYPTLGLVHKVVHRAGLLCRGLPFYLASADVEAC